MSYEKVKPELKKMFDKHGVVFNCAVTYMMDIGFENAVSINEEAMYKKLKEDELEQKKSGHPVVTTEFQMDIVKIAKEIAKIAIPMDVLTFAKEYMPLPTGNMEKDRALIIIRNLIDVIYMDRGYSGQDEYEEFRKNLNVEIGLKDNEWSEIYGTR